MNIFVYQIYEQYLCVCLHLIVLNEYLYLKAASSIIKNAQYLMCMCLV